MKRKSLLLLAFLLVSIGMITAQVRRVTGTVISEEDGEPIVGASILVKGTTLGTVTDIDGQFTISEIPASSQTMVVSYIGMQAQEVTAKAQPMRIVLKADTEQLDEVIVVAYGTAKKSSFTGSAAVMKSDKLEKRQVSNISNALSGAVAGVQTMSSNGQPGTSATVRIRGIGSINASNSPLYVVDGIPFDGDISSINSQDIESMTVLKDAAAAALYGARGANGVIMVTTKKGKTGDARVTFDARWGSNSRMVGKYDVMESADQYMETLYQAHYNAAMYKLGYGAEAAHQYANGRLFPSLGYQVYTLPEGENLIGTDGKINPNATLGYSDGQYYYTPDNWEKGTISSQLRQEYNMSVSGGSDRLNYYFSAGYLEDNGVIENSGFNRISTRLNTDYQAKKWMKLGVSLSYTNSKSKYPDGQTSSSSSTNAFALANNLAPVYPMYVRNADGSMKYDANTGYKVYDYGDGSSTNFTRNWMSMANPTSSLLYDTEEYLMDILNSKFYVDITPIEGLKLTASWGAYIDNTRYNALGNKYYGQSAQYGGTAQQEHYRTSSFNQQYLANYRKSFGLNNFDLMVGYESYDYRYEYSYATGQNIYKDGDYTVNNTIDQKRGGGARSEYSTRGIFSRLNYDYDGKYFGSVSYRRDASSRFHPDHRWGNFWSASAAWEISKENFMDDAEWVDNLKVKASYGQQGNDGVGNNYAYLDQYTMTGADGVFSDGTLAYKGNPDLTWEKSGSFNVGVDFGFFGHKLDGSVEYFSRKTTDMLYNKPVASSNGYSSIPMNIGSMTNSGWEIDLTYTPVQTKNLKWSVNANGTFLKNKINKLHPDLEGQLISGSRIYQEGESMYQLYLIRYAGVDKATGKALYWAKDDNGEDYTTSSYSVALNNKQATGDLLPTVYGGFGTSLEFYGFDFSVMCSYQLGGKIWDYSYQDLMHGGNTSNVGQNWHKDILNAWTPENPNTNIPALNASDDYVNASSDRWLVTSNYLSINNVTLGYTFPKAMTRRMGLESLRIYGVCDNLALFSARKGLDPRQNYVYSEGATYGALRTVSGGIKLVF
jgi:TonB-linked SusC/RagA family outer membrane protein